MGDTNTFFTDGNYGEAYPKASDMTNSSNGIPFLTGGNLKDGKLDITNASYITPEKHAKLTSGHLLEDDIVIAVRGSLGALGYVKSGNSGWNINSQLAILRTDKSVLSGKYLIQYLLSGIGQKELLTRQTGSALKQLPIGSVKDVPIPITSVEEQTKIGEFLANIDSLITLHQREIKELKIVKREENNLMKFNKEADFEDAVITALQKYGWEDEVIKYPTEEDLIQNWAKILYENNSGIDRLNDQPLTDEEMQELLDQIRDLRSPMKLNSFINGNSVAITRKNPNDKLHYGKEVSLKIYDRNEIAAGQSRYQIVEQPLFPRHEKVLQDRRGDLMLLINGMPLFHIELKKSGIPVSEACNQIQTYAHEQVFTGLFSLVQIFVAMNPEETVYFANPGPDGQFNSDFYFHWADFNNDPINDWKKTVEKLLSIPMAHKLIGFYTVADATDGILKVLRSYQYYAASAISDRVAKKDWEDHKQLGGYVWHTTGSGKTMTSFKSAQLIAESHDADKVVFLMDRIELGVQSLSEYQNFADHKDDVQGTEDTYALITKLKSDDPKETLIVSSIQKMSNIKEDAKEKLCYDDLQTIQDKRLVFIIDECHRSTFGEMLLTIKNTFPRALFFGFTGTPVFKENEKILSTTSDIFGDELHRYSIADGIRDGNVLGFDPTMVMVYKDRDVRRAVALDKAKASSEKEAIQDPKKNKVYYHYMNDVPMAGDADTAGIEDFFPKVNFETDEYQRMVVEDILDNWGRLSRYGQFHAIFATSSIPEAIRYYRKFKDMCPQLHVTCLFDASIDNKGGQKSIDKEDGLAELIQDYNDTFGQTFSIGTYGLFKKDVSSRLAHKGTYFHLKEKDQLDLLIVVNQMLTGFDSKYVNTLYLDKVLTYEHLIQAFSRTNRLYDRHMKPFGSIRYYRYPHTMKRNVENAMKLYSGDRPRGLFAYHLYDNINQMNRYFSDIKSLFEADHIENFERLPDDVESKKKFSSLFKRFSMYFEAAKIQGMKWEQKIYETEGKSITLVPTEKDYDILLQRYKELGKADPGDGGEDIPYDIDPYLTELDTGKIDNDYMNMRFKKWLKMLSQANVSEQERIHTLEELHKSFAFLSQEDQGFATLFLHDVQNGDVQLIPGKTFREYIAEYGSRALNDEVHYVAEAFGCSEEMLRKMLNENITKENINEYGRLDALKQTVDKKKAQVFIEEVRGTKLPLFRVNNAVDQMLTNFITSGGKEFPHVA